MKETNTVTRKEIASAAEISERTVMRHESEWGLNKHRSRAKQNPVLFFRDKVSKILLELRIIQKPL
jgi:hypothetical protein